MATNKNYNELFVGLRETGQTKSNSTELGIWIIITGGHGGRGRLWQPVQNMILWTPTTKTIDVWLCITVLWVDWHSQEWKKNSLNLASVSFSFVVNFLFEEMRKDKQVSTPHFLKNRWSFQITNHETTAFYLSSKVTEDTLKSDCKFVISVFFVVTSWTKNKNLHLFLNAKNVHHSIWL